VGAVLSSPCGCGMPLQACRCETAEGVNEFIAKRLQQGGSTADLKSAVVKEDAQQVLPVSEIPGPLSSEEFRKIPRSYEIAREIPELLSQLPCFCACTRLGHRNLLDCFKSTHASRCDICMDEAILASDLYEQGKSVEEIRREITRVFFRYEGSRAGAWKRESLVERASSFLRSIFR